MATFIKIDGSYLDLDTGNFFKVLRCASWLADPDRFPTIDRLGAVSMVFLYAVGSDRPVKFDGAHARELEHYLDGLKVADVGEEYEKAISHLCRDTITPYTTTYVCIRPK